MKKLRFLSISIILIFMFCSCSKEEPIEQSITRFEGSKVNTKAIGISGINHKVGIEKAQEEAISAMDFFNNTEMLKSDEISERKVSSIKTYWLPYESSSLIKLGEDDNKDSIAVYAFNFVNDKGEKAGFTLVSGDDRLPSVLGCSLDGELRDSIWNPGLATFLSNMPDFIKSTIEEYEIYEAKCLDSIINEMNLLLPDTLKFEPENNQLSTLNSNKGIEWGISNLSVSPWQTIRQYGPLLSVTWGQNSPYDDKAPACGTGHAKAGCVATAIAQIMSYHQHPDYYNGTAYNWNAMTEKRHGSWLEASVQNQIATLFAEIGEPENTNMEYGCDESLANDGEAYRCFNNMGYNTSGVLGYNLNRVKESLSGNLPVYVSGNAKKATYGWWIFTYTTYKEGHAWVIDGYKKRYRTISYTIRLTVNGNVILERPYRFYQYDEYVNCNWGWSNYQNGYYISGVFNTNNGPAIKTGTSYYYKYDLKVITNINPE